MFTAKRGLISGKVNIIVYFNKPFNISLGLTLIWLQIKIFVGTSNLCFG